MGKRKDDTAGPTPGERVEKWLSNAKIALALWLTIAGGVAYTASPALKTWIHGADDIVPSEAGFNEQVIHAIEKINEKLDEQDATMKKLQSRDYTDQQKLQKQINAINELVN